MKKIIIATLLLTSAASLWGMEDDLEPVSIQELSDKQLETLIAELHSSVTDINQKAQDNQARIQTIVAAIKKAQDHIAKLNTLIYRIQEEREDKIPKGNFPEYDRFESRELWDIGWLDCSGYEVKQLLELLLQEQKKRAETSSYSSSSSSSSHSLSSSSSSNSSSSSSTTTSPFTFSPMPTSSSTTSSLPSGVISSHLK